MENSNVSEGVRLDDTVNLASLLIGKAEVIRQRTMAAEQASLLHQHFTAGHADFQFVRVHALMLLQIADAALSGNTGTLRPDVAVCEFTVAAETD